MLRLDGFVGSGTTVIAAERTGRRCYGLELDPGYVDTIIRRWQKLTGDSALHSASGRRFDDLADEMEAANPRLKRPGTTRSAMASRPGIPVSPRASPAIREAGRAEPRISRRLLEEALND